jgi:hypothetical protein
MITIESQYCTKAAQPKYESYTTKLNDNYEQYPKTTNKKS